MNAFDIIIVAVIALSVVAVLGFGIYKKVKGKGGCCDCGCSSCGACHACDKCKNEENKDTH